MKLHLFGLSGRQLAAVQQKNSRLNGFLMDSKKELGKRTKEFWCLNGTTSGNFMSQTNWYIPQPLWLELGAGEFVSRGTNDWLAADCRAILQLEDAGRNWRLWKLPGKLSLRKLSTRSCRGDQDGDSKIEERRTDKKGG